MKDYDKVTIHFTDKRPDRFIPDISREKYDKLGLDESYDKYCNRKNFSNLTDFSKEDLSKMEVIVENLGRKRKLVFACVDAN